MRTRSRSWLHLVALLVATAALSAGLAPAGAAPPTSDPSTAAAYGARWIARQVSAGGALPDFGGDPAVGPTVGGALALAAARVEGETFERMLHFIETGAESYISSSGDDSPGAIGYLLLLSAAAGEDPTSFAGIDLVSRLGETLGDFAPGLYGAADPTYDGVIRQSLAILGLVANGYTPPEEAIDWLLDQQCPAGSAAGTVGAWQAYRADTSEPCQAPDPGTFSGPDTNSTAFAFQALVAAGESPAHDVLDLLASWQQPDGGFEFLLGAGVDPNSTALVVQAIVAGGEDPAAGRWVQPGGSAMSSLLAWQLGCDQAASDQGAFASPFSDGAPDLLATTQAVWGASGQAFPFAGPVVFGPSPEPCQPSTTTTAPSSTTSAQQPDGTAVAATPRYAG